MWNVQGVDYTGPPPTRNHHTPEHTNSLSLYVQTTQHNYYHPCNLRKATGG